VSMRRALPLVLAAATISTALAGTSAAAPAPDETQTLARLVSGITRLKVRKPVVVVRPGLQAARARRAALDARFYPPASRAHDAVLYHALGLAPSAAAARRALEPRAAATVFFDVERRRLVLARGTKPTRFALVREVATALQDEHFGLGRALRRSDDRDARAAARAASEGYSRLVAQLLARQPPAPSGSGRLGRFLALEEGFYGSHAVRFAADLRNLGSNRAVWTALRAFPASTEQVLHLSRFLERERPLAVVLPEEADGRRLASRDTFGELSVRALLATAGVAGLDRVATGWGGGRTAVYRSADRDGVVLALDWDSPAHAGQWAEAARRLEGLLTTRPSAFLQRGRRTVLAFADDAEGAERLARAILAL
jgi:hypothetical protein